MPRVGGSRRAGEKLVELLRIGNLLPVFAKDWADNRLVEMEFAGVAMKNVDRSLLGVVLAASVGSAPCLAAPDPILLNPKETAEEIQLPWAGGEPVYFDDSSCAKPARLSGQAVATVERPGRRAKVLYPNDVVPTQSMQ